MERCGVLNRLNQAYDVVLRQTVLFLPSVKDYQYLYSSRTLQTRFCALCLLPLNHFVELLPVAEDWRNRRRIKAILVYVVCTFFVLYVLALMEHEILSDILSLAPFHHPIENV